MFHFTSLNRTFTTQIDDLNTNLATKNIINKSFGFRHFGNYDLDTLENGFFWVWCGAGENIHLPNSTVGYGFTFGDEKFKVQIVIDTVDNGLYYRTKYDSVTYGDWIHIT